MKVKVIRTAMIGGGLSYDVYVPVSEVKNYDGTRYITIDRHGELFVTYVSATIPEEHFAMERGWARLDDLMQHDRTARIKMLDIAECAFPELGKIRRDGRNSLPELWVTDLLEHETSAEQDIEV